jgi:hypothetical protein
MVFGKTRGSCANNVAPPATNAAATRKRANDCLGVMLTSYSSI